MMGYTWSTDLVFVDNKLSVNCIFRAERCIKLSFQQCLLPW